MILHDNETSVDFLYYESIAYTIKELLETNTNKPITIGIHGDWGAGKSSILAMIEESYKEDKNTLCLKFNGWLFQGFEDAKLVLLEKVISEVQAKRSTVAKVKEKAQSLYKRINWMKAAKTYGQTVVSYISGLPSPETLAQLSESAKELIENPSDQLTIENFKKVADPIKDIIDDKKGSSIPHEMHAFRQEFEELLKEAKINQLIILIDDLDRCLPKTVIETLEALRLFLFVPKTAFIIAADEAMIEYAVKEHFPNLPNTVGATSYARNYLEKLIQIPFRIPPLGSSETLTYMTLLLALREMSENSQGFKALKNLSREAIQKPWLDNSLNEDNFRKLITNSDEQKKAFESFHLAKQISPMINEGTAGNPRQIKRFINSLMLRKQIAKARGFDSEIQLNVLAKIMLAENFNNEFYRELNTWAFNSIDGKSNELKNLEESDSTQQTKKGTKANSKENEWMHEWVQVNPKLKDVDLRPYLFVTRDKKTRFGVITQSETIQELVNKLLGSDMSVAGEKENIEALDPSDAETVYEHLKESIIHSGNLQKQPNGVTGIKSVIKIHPFLQKKYCSLLDTLDINNLGSWVITPIENFTDENGKKQYIQLLDKWHNQKENKILSQFANTTLNPKRSK